MFQTGHTARPHLIYPPTHPLHTRERPSPEPRSADAAKWPGAAWRVPYFPGVVVLLLSPHERLLVPTAAYVYWTLLLDHRGLASMQKCGLCGGIGGACPGSARMDSICLPSPIVREEGSYPSLFLPPVSSRSTTSTHVEFTHTACSPRRFQSSMWATSTPFDSNSLPDCLAVSGSGGKLND
ncbi:hypothetical protein PVAP13_3KG536375 [Panicum virgatum]|uniref:Uncharacterized protein n=1 Tax=Panicum virgatum TaxID=38727 RepID=A0A8T0V8A1_PANVG|nr:hypothetical protein PVAP13_3KG536375 [Panicum virgatum]